MTKAQMAMAQEKAEEVMLRGRVRQYGTRNQA